jgi:hypothetical protein
MDLDLGLPLYLFNLQDKLAVSDLRAMLWIRISL